MRTALLIALLLSKGYTEPDQRKRNNELQIKAYDCSLGKANYTEISLHDVKDCNNISARYKEGKSVQAQILQYIDEKSVDVLRCKITVSLRTNYCHAIKLFYNHTKPAQQISREEPLAVTEPQCRNAAETKKFNLNYDERLITIDMNEDLTARGDKVIEGAVDPETSKCTPKQFWAKDQFYKNNILTLQYDIEIARGTATMDFKGSTLWLDETLRTKDIKSNYLFDTRKGNFFWKHYYLTDKCDRLKEITTIPAVLHEPVDEDSSPIIMLDQKTGSQKIAIALKGTTNLCGQELRTTFTNELLIFIANSETKRITAPKLEAEDIDQLLDIKLQFSSSNLQTEIRTASSFNKVAAKICKNARKIIIQELATYGNMQAAHQKDIRLKGKLVLSGGGMIRKMDCSLTEATVIKNITKCYADIPVIYNNQEQYVDSVTYIIRPSSDEIHCSSFMPAKFKIEKTEGASTWICYSPELYAGQNCIPPSEISPMQHKMLYTPHIHHLDSSIYTKDQLKDYSRPYYQGERFWSPFRENPRDPHGNADDHKLKNIVKSYVEDNNHSLLEILAGKIFHSKLFMLNYIEIPMVIYFVITVVVNTINLLSQAYVSFQNNGCNSKIIITMIVKLILVGLPIQSNKQEKYSLSYMERNLLIREVKEQVLQEIANYKTTKF